MLDKLNVPRQQLRERGMATVEYALGVVVVIVIIGAIALSIPLKRLCNLIQHRLLRGKRLLNAKEYRGTYAA